MCDNVLQNTDIKYNQAYILLPVNNRYEQTPHKIGYRKLPPEQLMGGRKLPGILVLIRDENGKQFI